MCWLIWRRSWNVAHNFWCSLTILAQHRTSEFSLYVKHTELLGFLIDKHTKLLMLPLAVLTLRISDFPHADNTLNFWCSLTILAQYRTSNFWLTVWIPLRTSVSFPSDVSCRTSECINLEFLIQLTFLSESPCAWLQNFWSLFFFCLQQHAVSIFHLFSFLSFSILTPLFLLI